MIVHKDKSVCCGHDGSSEDLARVGNRLVDRAHRNNVVANGAQFCIQQNRHKVFFFGFKARLLGDDFPPKGMSLFWGIQRCARSPILG